MDYKLFKIGDKERVGQDITHQITYHPTIK